MQTGGVSGFMSEMIDQLKQMTNQIISNQNENRKFQENLMDMKLKQQINENHRE